MAIEKKFTGAGDLDHIGQRAERAAAYCHVLTLALATGEDVDRDAIAAMLDLIEIEVGQIALVAGETSKTLEAQAVTQ